MELRGDVEIVPDDDYSYARQVGQKYGGTDLSYADRPGESRVGVILKPIRVWSRPAPPPGPAGDRGVERRYGPVPPGR